MKTILILHRSDRAAWLVAAIASITMLRCVVGGTPANKRTGTLPDSDRCQIPIAWKSDPKHQNAVIWSIELDRVGSMAVGEKTVVIAGHQSAGKTEKGSGRCVGLSKETGKILWNVTHEAIPQRVHDMVGNISSTPYIDGDRVYYLSNRGELCCVGLADGHVHWMLDMPAKLGVYKRDPGDAGDLAPSPIVVGDIVYCVTANGIGDGFRNVPAPDAPSFLAVEKLTGKVIWSSNLPGKNINYGQWSTPAWAIVAGVPQILFPGGDGILYAFEPLRGALLWKIDADDPLIPRGWPRDSITAPPLVVGQSVVISPGLDHELSGGSRRLLLIDLPTHQIRWSAFPRGFNGTLGPMAAADGIVYAAGAAGVIVAVDAGNGNVRWTRDIEAGVDAGLCLHDGKLYIAHEDGALVILSAATGQILDECDLHESCIGTPVIDGDRVFVTTRHHAWAIGIPGQ